MTLGFLLHWSQKLYNNISYSMTLQLWGLYLNFERLDHQVECLNNSTTNHNLKNE